MKVTKIDNTNYQILTTADMTAPDGTVYTKTLIDVISLEQLNFQKADLESNLAIVNSKIQAISTL